MYLKALEIQGFKSFPDKTVLNFSEDITAIVGPNGSGKSNISDAILWVMGEQSSRQLRGAKMEDVIFGGTAKRGPMGFAQVTLVIDNTEHIFHRDETEVAVTRRYYRSGESEYYINKQSVRLRDVNELFMDTGMGREGYSIIGQGKIDEILSVKSGERREVFEEAAGISKYRHRKEESERKLERTEENLVRINDKIAELELQVDPLRKQAETAKQYLIYRDELRVLEISVWLENLQTLRTEALKLAADLKTAQTDQQQAKATLDEVYAEAERCGEEVRENDIAAEELRSQIADLDGKVSREEADIAVLQTDIRHSRESMERLDQDMSDSRQRSEALQAQMDDIDRRTAEIDEESTKLDEEIEKLLKETRILAESTGTAEADAEALRAREALELTAAAEERAQLTAIQTGLFEAAQRRADLVEELNGAKEKRTNAEKNARDNQERLTKAQEEEQSASNIIQGYSLKMGSRRHRAEEAGQRKLNLTMEDNNLRSRIHLLSEMEKEYEGFSKAVKGVMHAAERGVLHGVHGPVASLMTTSQEYTVAIETALGGGMQNIVVDREEDAKAAISFLKRRDGGRATFLPMTAIRGEELHEPGIEEEYGFVGIASRLIHCEKRYDAIFRSLLGRTAVVEDLDCGITMARRYHNRFRIVTLDGQVINRGGSMTGGSASRSAGILSRANELETLRERAASLASELEEATEQANELNRELQQAEYELNIAKAQQQSAKEEVLTLEGKQKQYELLLSGFDSGCENMAKELQTLKARAATDTAKADTIEKSIVQHQKQAEELHRQAEVKQAGQSDLRAKTQTISESVSQKRATQAALAAEKKTSAKRRADLLSRKNELLEDHSSREILVKNHQNDILLAEMKMEAHRAQAETLRKNGSALQLRLQELSDKKLVLEGRRTAQNQKIQEHNDAVLEAERESGRLEQKVNANRAEEKTILDKLWDRYELSHSDACEQRIELESVSKANRRIGELNRAIKALGTPNIGAIEEFERVNTRYTYLSEQRSDVEKAKDELRGVIDEITRQMTEIFAQQFQLLSESFQETFLELFGGGQARLELEDENDILGCGIEIKVQPPGKQLKTITLLSGGEKAFVAIALYFAILKVHPTPFCVMDEIEAALDEANVVRYARYMRRIAGKTQFIVITHRRGTMEEADVLYGVTMQERGVSRILTINLNEMSKELKIK